jgi:CPA1 family monovalent cation:H+ antiporter
VGSVVAGWLIARPLGTLMARIDDAPSTVIVQFVTTFAIWLAAERLGLSGVVTIVVFGLAIARRNVASLPARLRVPSFAIWETVTVVLNVLAFTLIGLQLRPLLEALAPMERLRYLGAALLILAVVIAVRLVWVFLYYGVAAVKDRLFGSPATVPWMSPPTARGSLVIGWSGMRGIVTLAAALAIPAGFPYRDFMQFAAFVVVLGTLLLQGLTLRPLILLLRLPQDTVLDTELKLARDAALQAALTELAADDSPAARRLREEYGAALANVRRGADPWRTPDSILRRRLVGTSRRAIQDLRSASTIGDEAFRRVEEELDWLELSTQSAGEGEAPGSS